MNCLYFFSLCYIRTFLLNLRLMLPLSLLTLKMLKSFNHLWNNLPFLHGDSLYQILTILPLIMIALYHYCIYDFFFHLNSFMFYLKEFDFERFISNFRFCQIDILAFFHASVYIYILIVIFKSSFISILFTIISDA